MKSSVYSTEQYNVISTKAARCATYPTKFLQLVLGRMVKGGGRGCVYCNLETPISFYPPPPSLGNKLMIQYLSEYWQTVHTPLSSMSSCPIFFYPCSLFCCRAFQLKVCCLDYFEIIIDLFLCAV